MGDVRLDSFRADVPLLLRAEEREPWCTGKNIAFFSVGSITLIFCLAELGIGVTINSLTLLSDGFHNLSDVVSLFIAYWATKAAKRDSTDEMSYGWARSETIGALTNGCFLISLCMYVALEAIPRFFNKEEIAASLAFLIIAGVGLGVNTIGTIVFATAGLSHGHSHSGGHGHSHGGGGGDDHEEDHGHGHGHGEKKKKKKGHGHGSNEEDHGHGHGHGHGHDKKKEKKEKEDHGHGHGHGKKKKKQEKRKIDWNMMAVFIHYLGDAVSSLFVLITGLIIHFYGSKNDFVTYYLDPVASLLIVVLILATTVPLIKRTAVVLMQSIPADIELSAIRHDLMRVEGVLNLHDLHAWQLVDGLAIGSVHVSCEEGVDFSTVIAQCKQVFHEHDIHSTAIQPEYVQRSAKEHAIYCDQNCVEECEEDWCCKKGAEKNERLREAYAITTEL